MRYSFDAAVAARYGVEEAILLDHIHFWCEKNRTRPACIQNGRSWMYATADQMAAHFPFWSAAKIRRLVKSLVRQGALLTGRFNRSAYDRTLWYALSDCVCSMLQICKMELTESKPSTDETVTAIKDTQEDIQKDTQHTYTAAKGGPRAPFSPFDKLENQAPKAGEKTEHVQSDTAALSPAAAPAQTVSQTPEAFERFWQAYPRKADKRAALLAWRALRPDAALVNTMLAALAVQSKSDSWKESGGRYIPHPARWLTNRRWEDAAPASQTSAYPMPAWAQAVSRPFDPTAAVDILAQRRPRRLKRQE